MLERRYVLRLHQFEAVAEGIEDVGAAIAIERSIGLDAEAGALAGGEDVVQGVNDKRWMSTFGRMKIGLDAEVQVHGSRGKPDTISAGHGRRLLYFREAEKAAVNSRARFSPTTGIATCT
jgi:hypothetical protein